MLQVDDLRHADYTCGIGHGDVFIAFFYGKRDKFRQGV